MDELVPAACTVCGTFTFQRCSRCKAVFYCSRAHSITDWPHHKTNCRTPVAICTPNTAADSRGSLFVDALLLPENEDTPRIIKVEYTNDPRDAYGNHAMGAQHIVDLRPWMYGPETALFERHGMNGTILEHPLFVKFNEPYPGDGHSDNQCIRKLTGGAYLPWVGNVVVLKQDEAHPGLRTYLNMTMSDLPPLIGCLRVYGAVIPRLVDRRLKEKKAL